MHVKLCHFPPLNMTYYLGKSTDSVLTRKQRWVFSNLKIKIYSFMCESRKFIAKAKFVCPVFGGCEGVTIILFLHLLVEHITIRIFSSTIYIVVTTCNNLQKRKNQTKSEEITARNKSEKLVRFPVKIAVRFLKQSQAILCFLISTSEWVLGGRFQFN